MARHYAQEHGIIAIKFSTLKILSTGLHLTLREQSSVLLAGNEL